MKKLFQYTLASLFILLFAFGCQSPPAPEKAPTPVKHNYIVLLDLSDRLIVQEDQSARDAELVKYIYELFEQKVKKELYIRSRDEIKVVIAPQRGAGLPTDVYEDRLFVNMESIPKVSRRPKETERRTKFINALDSLYEEARFSANPEDYYGADIWKYFYEDLEVDYANDSLTRNFLFILTDGYPIVGKDQNKLEPVNKKFPELTVAVIEAAPRDKDLEWDHIQQMWTEWFDEMGIADYHFIKRRAISKEKQQIRDIISEEEI